MARPEYHAVVVRSSEDLAVYGALGYRAISIATTTYDWWALMEREGPPDPPLKLSLPEPDPEDLPEGTILRDPPSVLKRGRG